ncbi:MAG: hypothetical protein ABR501_03235 [Pyrinomonadaceae bacterium]
MSKRISILATVLLILSTAAFAAGQQTQTTTTTVTKTVQNADGTYTVIEYPVGKETTVTLNRVTIPGGSGTATILRDDDGTRIKLNLSGLPNDVTTLNLYAVDPTGIATSLGPIAITNGLGAFTTTTPLNKFMLIASPETSLTTYDPNTKVFFRSAVPAGLAVVPFAQSGPKDGAAIGDRVAATATPATASPYSVPMLGIPNFRRGTDTHLRVKFPEFNNARANVFIEPRHDGPTTIKMRFHSLKRVPADKRIVLWAVAPDGTFNRIGQIVNTRHRNEAQIQTETALKDFGLLVTLEDKDSVPNPSGPTFATVVIDNRK